LKLGAPRAPWRWSASSRKPSLVAAVGTPPRALTQRSRISSEAPSSACGEAAALTSRSIASNALTRGPSRGSVQFRRRLDELTRLVPMRLAARGFTVMGTLERSRLDTTSIDSVGTPRAER